MTAHNIYTLQQSNPITKNRGSRTPELCITDTSKNQDNQSNPKSGSRRALHIQRQQERILLLRHAVKCKTVPGKCSNPLCLKMKILTKHMTLCREGRSCKYPHCVSSKTLLAHYSRCSRKETSATEKSCLVCKPVRDSIYKEKASCIPCGSMNSVLSHFSQISIKSNISKRVE